MYPHAGKAAPISLEIAVRVAPESASHANPGLAHDQFPNFAPHRMASVVSHVGVHPWHRGIEATRHDGPQRDAANDAAAGLGPARVVDDRATPLAHLLKVPAP